MLKKKEESLINNYNMIAHIQGRLVEKTPTEVIIDCNGVGYHINIALHTVSLVPES